MDIRFYEINWKYYERAKEMRDLIYEYRKAFRLYNNSDIQIWKTLIKYYNKHWMELHYDSYKFD